MLNSEHPDLERYCGRILYYPVNYLPVWDPDFRYSGPGRGERNGFSESTRDNQRGGSDDYKERTDTFLRIAQLSELEAIRAGYGKIHSIARGIQQTRENLEVIQEEQFRRATLIIETAQADEKKRKEKEAADKRALRTVPAEASPSTSTTLPPAKPSKPAPTPEPFSRSPSPSQGAPKRAHARVSEEQLDAKLPKTDDAVASKKIKTARSLPSVDPVAPVTSSSSTNNNHAAALQKISEDLQKELAVVDVEKLPSPQVDKPKRGLGKGPLVPSPAQVLTRDKAAAAATEEERKRKEKIAVQESHDFIRLKQEEEHAKFLVQQAADKQKTRAKQDAKKAKLLEQLQALQAQQSEEEDVDLVCAEGEEGGLRILAAVVVDP